MPSEHSTLRGLPPAQLNGAAQAPTGITNPARAACGSCHDNVNFATGANHAGDLPQYNDSQCSNCHIPQETTDFDASIDGRTRVPEYAPSVPGINFTLVSVANGAPGKTPTVTFTVKDNSGNADPDEHLLGEFRVAVADHGRADLRLRLHQLRRQSPLPVTSPRAS